MDVELNFINRSNDVINSQILVFAKNDGAWPVAWQVIKYCGQGDNHPFVLPDSFQVGVVDAWGNHSPRLDAELGQVFEERMTVSGDELVLVDEAGVPSEVQIRNGLNEGAITACVFKAGKLFAQKSNLEPGQTAVFRFSPTLWIGAVSQMDEGDVLIPAVVECVNTEISLEGIASADIVMTGGGSGSSAQPFVFSLQNVVTA